MNFYKKTIFWEALRDSFAALAGPTQFTLHKMGSDDGWMIAAGIASIVGFLIGKWMVDHNKNGIVDLFE